MKRKKNGSMKECSKYQKWKIVLWDLIAAGLIISALWVTKIFISDMYAYKHPNIDNLFQQDAAICSGNIVEITNTSYISRFGMEHFCYEISLDNGQILDLENELVLISEMCSDSEYDEENYDETIAIWINGLQIGDTLHYTVRKSEQNKKRPIIFSLAVNGEELITLEQVNAMKTDINLQFKEAWGVFLFAVLAIWFGVVETLIELAKKRKQQNI